jgi:Polyphosphate kinase 2 (PPK2)
MPKFNDFEEQLIEHGVLVVKFWLAISKDEQLHRFQDRQNTPYKRYKIMDEDWRNREKWDAYALAVRHDRPDQQRECSVDARRVGRQTLRPRQDPEDTERAARGRALIKNREPSADALIREGQSANSKAGRQTARGSGQSHTGFCSGEVSTYPRAVRLR